MPALSGRLPAVLAFALLLWQIAIPWTSHRFTTQDGPSHLYTATVLRELLFNPSTAYKPLFIPQTDILTNWGTAVLLNLAALLVGISHAEQLLASAAMASGFFSFAYFVRSLAPQTSPWSPVLNFLLHSWFLWIGFHNFYAAMVLCPLIAGYIIRQNSRWTWLRGTLAALALSALAVTHTLVLGIALILLACVALWTSAVAPLMERRGIAWRPLLAVAVLCLPGVALAALFLSGHDEAPKLELQGVNAWRNFPRHAFASAAGRFGEQLMVYPAILMLSVAAVWRMRRDEWLSARGGVVLALPLLLAIYLVAPDSAFGAGELKIRFAWAFFIFAALLMLSVEALRPLQAPVAAYITLCLAVTLYDTMTRNVRGVARAIDAYTAALAPVPPGSTLVRLRFNTDHIAERFRFRDIALDPLLHAEALTAAERRLRLLSDYQTLSYVFPVRLRRDMPEHHRWQLWQLESGGEALKILDELLASFPERIDYVVVLNETADGPVAELRRRFELVSRDPEPSFVWVFRVPHNAVQASGTVK